MPKNLRWLLYKTDEEKFPYKIYLEEKPGEFLILKVQARWPGPGGNLEFRSCNITYLRNGMCPYFSLT